MPALPQLLDREANIELRGRGLEPWLRRGALVILLAFVCLALANVFGQRPARLVAQNAVARLTVNAPAALRSGLYYQASFRIDAFQALDEPALVLDPGWFAGVTSNSVQPDALGWAQRNGRNILSFGRIPRGGHLVVHLQFQVNPTTVGRRTTGVVLENAGQPIIRIDKLQTIFP
jgi:hypothetical protein